MGCAQAGKPRRLEGVNSLHRVHLPISENLCFLPTFHCCVGNSRSFAGLGGLQQVRPGQGRGLLDTLTPFLAASDPCISKASFL